MGKYYQLTKYIISKLEDKPELVMSSSKIKQDYRIEFIKEEYTTNIQQANLPISFSIHYEFNNGYFEIRFVKV